MKRYWLTAIIGTLLCAAIPGTANAVADGNINCGTSGTFTIMSEVVTRNTGCVGTLDIPLGVTSIGRHAFRGATSMGDVLVPSTVRTIETSAFEGTTGLSNITLGSGVTTIEPFAFYNTNLISVTFGVSVTTIGSGAFFNARSLSSLNFLGPQPTAVNATAFFLVPSNAKVYVTSENALSFGGIGARWNGFTVALTPTSSPTPDANAEMAAARARDAAAREAARQVALRQIALKLSASEAPSLDQFKAADFNSVTEMNLPHITRELIALPENIRSEEATLKKVTQKYLYLDQIAMGDQFKAITAQQLVFTGILPAENRNAITFMLRKLEPSQRETYDEIYEAINSKIAEMESRKARLAATLARRR